jgi:hypothetical protein
MMKGERTPQYGDFIIDYNFRFCCYEVFGYKVDDFGYGFFKKHNEAVKYALDSGNTVWERKPGDRFTKITNVNKLSPYTGEERRCKLKLN